ncbi:MAG: nucleotidyl transferase AbiEii/AbiGii toxin family protein [Bryobacterales bacterium]|nr:nucleotidyl transferase AbiEii/AbiGii toxin family protein [Bryobacterales bacterium]
MSPERRYASGTALRTALEERLKRVSREDGIDLQRLRRQVAFDRFLARLFREPNSNWVLKGGYAMELRFQTARSTKDLDFTVRVAPAGRDDILLKQIQDVGVADLGDFFTFRIGEAMMDLDGAPYGGARYPVESIMGGRIFVKFHLDVGIGDVVLDPLEQARMRDWLEFAGILPPAVPMIQQEQQFAEKLHAYTLPRTAPNSRVRDLVDIAILIQFGTLESKRVMQALHATFDLRATHSVPKTLNPPPEEWNAPFARMAAECRLELSASEAFRILVEFYTDL